MNAGVEADLAWMDVWCDRLPPVLSSDSFDLVIARVRRRSLPKGA